MSQSSTQEAFSVSGMNVVITGAAMGIGYGIARRFARAGAGILLVDRDEDALRKATDALAKIGKVTMFSGDVGEESVAEKAIERCVGELGSIQVLVNNAGIYPQIPVLQMSSEEFDRVIRVNLRSVFLFARSAGRQMIKQATGGRIINIASIDAFHPSMVGLAAYDASKGGVRMLTESLALELAPHRVLVTGIAPGGVATEGTERPVESARMSPADVRRQMEEFIQRKVPLGRIGVPDEIATVAQFLASAASAYMTGTTVVVDGGALLA